MRASQLQREIGAALRAARWARGITQEELSSVLGINRSTFARYEAGDRSIPATVLIRSARYLGLTVDELLGFVPAEPGPGRVSEANQQDMTKVLTILRHHPALTTMVRKLLETMPESAATSTNTP